MPLLGNRRDCGIHRSGRDRRDHGRIDDVKIIHSVNAQVAVDDGVIAGSHLAGPDRMVVRHGGVS